LGGASTSNRSATFLRRRAQHLVDLLAAAAERVLVGHVAERNDAITMARQVGPLALQGLGQRQDIGRDVARTVRCADHQQHVVRLEVADARCLVGDIDRMACARVHRLQRVGHHLGIARFGSDQDQNACHFGTDIRAGVPRCDATGWRGDSGGKGPSMPRRRKGVIALGAVCSPDAQPPAAAQRHEQRADRTMNHDGARPRDQDATRRGAMRHRPGFCDAVASAGPIDPATSRPGISASPWTASSIP
jgi:hypothetical protein